MKKKDYIRVLEQENGMLREQLSEMVNNPTSEYANTIKLAVIIGEKVTEELIKNGTLCTGTGSESPKGIITKITEP